MTSVLVRGAVPSWVGVTLRRGSRLRRDGSGAGRSLRVAFASGAVWWYNKEVFGHRMVNGNGRLSSICRAAAA
jgi:hypothetical protein